MASKSSARGGEGPAQILFNICERSKVPRPDIKYSFKSVKGGQIVEGSCNFGDKNFCSQGKNKKEIQSDICDKILAFLKIGGAGRELQVQTLHLSQLCPSGEREHRSSTRRGTTGASCRAKKRDKFLARYKDWVYKTCPSLSCGYANFVKYSFCYKCNTTLEVLKDDEIWWYLDIERVESKQESPPLSIGVFAINSSGTEIARKDIIITPDGKNPGKTDWCSIHKHRMYVGFRNGQKVVMKRGKLGEADRVLASVTPKRAAHELVELLGSSAKDNIIFFHGEDEKCLLPFLRSMGLEEKFKENVKSMIDTRGFFLMLDRGNKIGMSTLVEQYGSREDQDLYRDGAHSSLVDAVLLSKVCGHFESEFSEWIKSDWLRDICRNKKMKHRFSDWLVWENI